MRSLFLVLFERTDYKVNMVHAGNDRSGKANRRLVAACSIIGILACVGDLFMTYLLGTWHPDHRAFFQPMSDLGDEGSPVALIASTWWIVMGVLFVVFGYGFHRAFSHHGKPAVLAAWMLALYGVGEGLGSGLVKGSPGVAFRTPGSIVHNLLGGVGVAAAFALPFIVMKIYTARESPKLYWYSWFTSFTGVFFFALFSISSFYRPEGSWISYTGLWQRLFMLVYYLFFICLAVLMLNRQLQSSGGGPGPRYPRAH